MGEPKVLDLIIEFGGGAELLFGNVKKHNVQLTQEDTSKWTIRKLLPWIQKNLLKERPELFIQDESVRPGILVLVNDADWELLVGELRNFYFVFAFVDGLALIPKHVTNKEREKGVLKI